MFLIDIGYSNVQEIRCPRGKTEHRRSPRHRNDDILASIEANPSLPSPVRTIAAKSALLLHATTVSASLDCNRCSFTPSPGPPLFGVQMVSGVFAVSLMTSP